MIYVLKGYQVQENYFGYPFHIFGLILLESQQTVLLSYFSSNVHVHLIICVWSYAPQTHLVTRLSFEPFRPLPVLMTMAYHHGSLGLLLVFSHLSIKVQNLMKVLCCTLVVEYTFFQSIIWKESLLLLFDRTVLDFLHFILCFRRIFLISAEWLILSTN